MIMAVTNKFFFSHLFKLLLCNKQRRHLVFPEIKKCHIAIYYCDIINSSIESKRHNYPTCCYLKTSFAWHDATVKLEVTCFQMF